MRSLRPSDPLRCSVKFGLTVNAPSFQDLESVNIYWNRGSTSVLTATAKAFGYLAPTTFTVP